MSFKMLLTTALIGTLSISASLSAPISDADGIKLSKTSVLDKDQAGYYRMKVGKADVITLSDGACGLGLEGLVINDKPGELAKLLEYSYEKSPISTSINAYLIRLNGKWVLVDAGSSDLVGPSGGKLPENLRRAGVKPEEISDIYITHVHPDHSGGLTDGKTKVFPNATIHVNRKELDYWLDKSLAEKATQPIKSFFIQAEDKLRPYIESKQIKTFDDATEFEPGFKSQPAYGHTPGHTFYVLEDAGQKLVFVGDLVHIPLAQFDNPNIAVHFDCDSPMAVERRKALFADAAAHGYLIAGAHLPFPGTGHVRADGDHYRWLPVIYIDDAATKR